MVVSASSPARGLHRLARAREVELIVVGSSERGAAGRVVLGSTGERLLHGSPCPVAVAPGGYERREGESPRRVVVAFDGSPESHAALELAASIAVERGAEVHVVGVAVPLADGPTDWPAPLVMTPAESTEEASRRAEKLVEAALAAVPRDVESRGLPRIGDPAAQILAAVEEESPDLLVAGSRGWGPVRRVLLGSVSAQLVRSATCPVIVTPRTETEDAATDTEIATDVVPASAAST